MLVMKFVVILWFGGSFVLRLYGFLGCERFVFFVVEYCKVFFKNWLNYDIFCEFCNDKFCINLIKFLICLDFMEKLNNFWRMDVFMFNFESLEFIEFYLLLVIYVWLFIFICFVCFNNCFFCFR